jgi:sphinganine-1-phosphate aldolase
MKRLPAQGRPHAEVLEELASFRTKDADYRGGRTWSLVYYAGDKHHDFLARAHSLYIAENGLNPMAFPSLRRMEAEVVEMTAGMLNAPDKAAGTMTSGGTESILVAVQAYRDRARKRWPWIRRPVVVLPRTAHPAFDKAAHYLGIRLSKARVLDNGRVDVRDMRRRIGRNTILMVASAPQYPTGAVDPIEQLGAIAKKRRVPFHVDACFGGFLLPWLERTGVAVPVFDFRVPGVTSMSADVHKYGYAAKGASVIVYRDMGFLRHQFFVSTDWPGGIYASPTMAGTRPGGSIAAAWAAMMAMGESGYLESARGAWQAAEDLRRGIRGIDGLRILGSPHSSVVTWAASDKAVNVYAVADILQERGWGVDRQQAPPSIHCSTTATHKTSVAAYVEDLTDAVATVRAHPELAKEGQAAMYGMMARIPLKGVVSIGVRRVMADLYGGADPQTLGTKS